VTSSSLEAIKECFHHYLSSIACWGQCSEVRLAAVLEVKEKAKRAAIAGESYRSDSALAALRDVDDPVWLKLISDTGRTEEARRAAEARLAQLGRASIRPLLPARLPGVTCSGCGRDYEIGTNAVVVTLEYAASAARSALFLGGATGDRVDLISSLDSCAPERLASAREKALHNWQAIRNGLSEGQHRSWRCAACNHVNPYSR
jgi:hypothetical protein